MKIKTIRPEVFSVGQLVTEIFSELRLPSIQRQFVWDDVDIRDLIDSITNNYPIGAIIILETDKKLPSVPLIDGENDGKIFGYIIDGQQRLTSLMLLKNGWKISRDGKLITCSPISVEAENRRFYVSSKRGIDVSLIVNAALGDYETIKRLYDEHSPTIVEGVLNDVGKRIINYQLPLYRIKTELDEDSDEDYERIAEIFVRVNSAGVPLGNIGMFLSFFASAFEEKKVFTELYEKLNDKYEIDHEPLIRFFFSEMGLKQRRITNIKSLKRGLLQLKERYKNGSGEISRVFDQGYRAVEIVFSLLDKELGISTTQNMPSQNVLIPLFDFVYRKGFESYEEIEKKSRNRMLYWFLIASFNGIYSSSPDGKIERDLNIIRANLDTFPLDQLLKAIKHSYPHKHKIEKEDIFLNGYTNILRGKTRRVLLMLLDMLLYLNRATDWSSRPLKSENAVVHHIFPREYLRSYHINDDLINSLGNLTFVAPEVNSELSDEPPSEYLRDYMRSYPKLFEEHMIPQNQELWEVEMYEDFLGERLNLIWNKLNIFLKKLREEGR